MNMQEAETKIKEMGELQVQGQKIGYDAEERIKEIRNIANQKIKVKQKAINRRLIFLFVFYKENWKELTNEGKRKLVKFVNGDIGEYLTQPGVKLSNTKNALKNLKIKGLGRFIREIEEIDKEAILMDPEAIVDISGIKVEQRQRFGVTPKETKEIVAEDVKKLKKLLL